MKRDVRAWYEKCPVCELSNAARNASHGRWRAVRPGPPRLRYGMDYYGVGDGHVLGLIDLDSRWVELEYHPRRSAISVARMVRERILHRAGTPAELRSDHAREFIGSTMTLLAKREGYLRTTTGGYSPTGNATMERFWRYLGRCLRHLSDEEYANVREHLSHISWAWNTTPSEATIVSPFEIMTGRKPRTAAGSFLGVDAPSDGEPRAPPIDAAAIRDAAHAYARVAQTHDAHMREHRARALNSAGRRLRDLSVGDFVKILRPPSAKEALRRSRKAKHIGSWCGPMRIVARPTASKFVVVYHFDESRRYERDVANVRAWRGPIPPGPPANVVGRRAVAEESELSVGMFVAVRETDASREVVLSKVVAVTDVETAVECYGSRNPRLCNAVFRKIFIEDDGGMVFGRPRQGHAATPWRWSMTRDDVDALVLCDDLKLTRSGKLTAYARRRVEAVRPKIRFRVF